MAEQVLDDLQVRACRKGKRGCAMTQAVQADRREPAIAGKPLEVTGDVLPPQRPAIRG